MFRRNTLAVILLSSLILLSGCVFRREKVSYDNLVEHWQNDTVFEGGAAEEALNALLDACESGDRDAFASCFTPELQKESSFDEQVDSFISAYPSGLKDCDMKYSPAGAGGSSGEDGFVRGAGAIYECTFDGGRYYIYIKFCYCNDPDPDKVGVEYFTIENEGAKAYNNYQSYFDEDYMSDVIASCDIRDDVDYRIIDNKPVYWTDTKSRRLTEDEIRRLLAEHPDIDDPEFKDALGEPNYHVDNSNSTGCRLYYELEPEDGEATYVLIIADAYSRKIYDAYKCTADSTDYDDPIYTMER